MEENNENNENNLTEEQIEYNKKAEKFSLWMQEQGWTYDEPSKMYMNMRLKQIVSVTELVEIYKTETNKTKQTTTKIETKTETKLKQLPETEGAEKLLKHKYKGTIKRYDLDPKKKTMFKHVILYNEDESLQEEYCFQTSYFPIQ